MQSVKQIMDGNWIVGAVVSPGGCIHIPADVGRKQLQKKLMSPGTQRDSVVMKYSLCQIIELKIQSFTLVGVII